MIFRSFALALFSLTLVLPTSTAFASPVKRPTRETYPAMEDGEIIVPRLASVPALQSIESKTASEKYEFIPAEKRIQVLRRMELCLSLIKETGRAYDYRVMTTEELEKELSAARSIRTADNGLDSE